MPDALVAAVVLNEEKEKESITIYKNISDRRQTHASFVPRAVSFWLQFKICIFSGILFSLPHIDLTTKNATQLIHLL